MNPHEFRARRFDNHSLTSMERIQQLLRLDFDAERVDLEGTVHEFRSEHQQFLVLLSRDGTARVFSYVEELHLTNRTAESI